MVPNIGLIRPGTPRTVGVRAAERLTISLGLMSPACERCLRSSRTVENAAAHGCSLPERPFLPVAVVRTVLLIIWFPTVNPPD